MRVALSHITSQEYVCVCVRANKQTSCIKTEINENKRTAHPSKDWKTNNNLIINLGHKSFFGQRAAVNALFTSGSADLSDWEFSPKRDICVNSPQTQSLRTITEEGTERIIWAAGWEGALRNAAFRIWHGHGTHSHGGYLQSKPQYRGWGGGSGNLQSPTLVEELIAAESCWKWNNDFSLGHVWLQRMAQVLAHSGSTNWK